MLKPCVRKLARILFSKTEPVKFVEHDLFGENYDDQGVSEEEALFLKKHRQGL